MQNILHFVVFEYRQGYNIYNGICWRADTQKGTVMDAREYSETLFGRVVDFDVVAQDHAEYAKVFASGSPELEKNLLTLWDYGFETLACGNGYDERMENFSLETEQNIQSRYDTYLNASGLQKLSMKKDDYIPKYHGYVSIDAGTIDKPELFQKTVTKELKPFKELSFSVEQTHTDGKPSVVVFLSVPRNRPSTYKEVCLGSIEPEKALKISLPEKTTFDKYFKAITSAVEKYSQRTGRKKGCLLQIEARAAVQKFNKLKLENQNLKTKLAAKERRVNEQAGELVDCKLQIKNLKRLLEKPVKQVQQNITRDGTGRDR